MMEVLTIERSSLELLSALLLERAGLISRGRDAQRRPCRLEAKVLAEADGPQRLLVDDSHALQARQVDHLVRRLQEIGPHFPQARAVLDLEDLPPEKSGRL